MTISATVGAGNTQQFEFRTDEAFAITLEASRQPYDIDIETKSRGAADSAYTRIQPLQDFSTITVEDTASHTYETNQVQEVVRVSVTNNSGRRLSLTGRLQGGGTDEYFVEDGRRWVYSDVIRFGDSGTGARTAIDVLNDDLRIQAEASGSTSLINVIRAQKGGNVVMPSGDLTDGENIIYDLSDAWVPHARLEHSSTLTRSDQAETITAAWSFAEAITFPDVLADQVALALNAPTPSQPTSGVNKNNSPRIQFAGEQIDDTGTTAQKIASIYVQPRSDQMDFAHLNFELENSLVFDFQENGNFRAYGNIQTLRSSAGYMLLPSGGSSRYGLKYGEAGAIGDDSGTMMLTNRHKNGDTAIAANDGTSGGEAIGMRVPGGSSTPAPDFPNGLAVSDDLTLGESDADLLDNAGNVVYSQGLNHVPAQRVEGGEDIVASGDATLSSGSATVQTGESNTNNNYTVYLDPSGDTGSGATSNRVGVSARLVWDGTLSTPQYVVEILEDGTNVGNPTVGWELRRTA